MSGDIKDLLTIMQQLRDPDNGCPWDIKQDFASIAPYTIEEAYEVADAIQRKNLDDLKEELGDLLLQVVFHSQMANEQGAFSFSDVVDSICEKMTRRHPHVFSDESVANADVQTKRWEEFKAEEKALKGKDHTESLLDAVPNNFPALKRAQKLTKKAASVGFDWPDASSVLDKLEEEKLELIEAIASNDQEHIHEELGDLLFVMTNLARKLKIDSDSALQSANQKFISRFQYIENTLRQQGINIEDSNLKEMDRLWDEAKKTEKL